MGDEQFEPLKPTLQEEHNIKYNPQSAFEHIGEIEHHIQTINKRIHATLCSFLCKDAILHVIVKEVVKHSMMMLNAILPKSGITMHLSPHNLVAGKTLNFKHHFKFPIRDYEQVHQQEEPRNSMAKRTLGAICLGPINNAQGGYKFMSLETRKMIKWFARTPILMTQEVIDPVLSLG